ncbi:dihydroxyacetone kinase [Heterostelium album PN500]|uniref:Dihydroxyacetone kinase n=1 Tax=Heterostelium pallidum (strain ATCC 26659 / Pp 5 / PN500) TaxID=670386 RepID=D3AY55_HETP5|nr:dihydroxyacetone kinase [Heterostelium album PN500]EFA85882.1 dihydroxyacetone kinase [Heterostelium album PN500]|eukprot:XP_020437988.1 dihydroxyacetone kinase [Heterostelium album PN500]
MKKLINDPNNVVNDMIDGLLLTNPSLKRHDNHSNVLTRLDAPLKNKVALISGGGSGHEPSHAGFIGVGMLSGAVLGNVFTSPTPSMVLSAIRGVTGEAGCLLIVKNYTGDRLNFAIAAEMARIENYKVEILIVGDDLATPSSKRGIAGTVLVHKILGALAEQDTPLEQLLSIGRKLVGNLNTIGVALSGCTIPAVGRPSFELPDDEMELGLGIHGEPGIKREKMKPVNEIVHSLVNLILEKSDPACNRNKKLVVLINNLGSTTAMEMTIVAGETVKLLHSLGYQVDRLIVGALMTALEMSGFSITLLPSNIDDTTTTNTVDIIGCIDYPTTAQYWPTNSVTNPPVKPNQVAAELDSHIDPNQHIYDNLKSVTISADDALLFKEMLKKGCHSLIENANILTDLDSKVGDGDLGLTLERAANNVLKLIDLIPFERPCYTLRKLSVVFQESLGGSSGPFYSIFFLRMSDTLFKSEKQDLTAWAAALKSGYEGIQSLGGAKLGDCTMLDALIPAIDSIVKSSTDRSLSLSDIIKLASEKAHEGAVSTIEMQSKCGRSSYIGERAKNHIDPGACAISVIFQSLKDVFKTEDINNNKN